MLFEDFLFMLECMNEGLNEEQNEKKLLESFGAWQITEIVKGLLTEKAEAISFQAYARNLGILEENKEETTEAERKREKAQALRTAEDILRIDRGQIA